MGKRENRYFDNDKKLSIIRKHLIDLVPVSKLCEEEQLRPSTYYDWQKTLLEIGSLDNESSKKRKNKENHLIKDAKNKIADLKERLKEKDSVLAELMGEYVALKKSINGES